MKSTWRYSLFAAVAGVLCLPAFAQQNVRPAPDRPGVQVDVDRNGVAVDRNRDVDAAHRNQADLPLRASKVIGMAVHNHQNEDLGNIEDLVLDAKTGKVRYAAVSMGGFLGLGDDLFAVPWAAIKLQKDEDGDYVLRVNVDKARMENARGFDQDNWPNFGDQRWQRENDARYDVEVDVDDKVRVETNNNNTRGPNIEIERNR